VVSGSRGQSTDLLNTPLARELLAAPLIATLATRSKDGTIHLVPMWFLWDGTDLLIPTSGTTQKARNIERDPRVSVMIDDSRAGLNLRGVTIRGEATLVRAPVSFQLNRAVHLKYVTAAQRDLGPVDAYLGTDDVTVRIRAHGVYSWDLSDTPAQRALET